MNSRLHKSLLISIIVLFSIVNPHLIIPSNTLSSNIVFAQSDNTFSLEVHVPEIIPVNTPTGFLIILKNNTEIVKTDNYDISIDIIDLMNNISYLDTGDQEITINNYSLYYVVSTTFPTESLYLVNITASITINKTSTNESIISIYSYRIVQTVDIVSKIQPVAEELKTNITNKIDNATIKIINAITGAPKVTLFELKKMLTQMNNTLETNLSYVINILGSINQTLDDVNFNLKSMGITLENITLKLGSPTNENYTVFKYLIYISSSIKSTNSTLVNNIASLAEELHQLTISIGRNMSNVFKNFSNLDKNIVTYLFGSEGYKGKSLVTIISSNISGINSTIFDLEKYLINNISSMLDGIESSISSGIKDVKDNLWTAVALIRNDIESNTSYLEIVIANSSSNIMELLNAIYGNVSLSDIKGDLVKLMSDNGPLIMKLEDIIDDLIDLSNSIENLEKLNNNTRDSLSIQLNNSINNLIELIRESNSDIKGMINDMSSQVVSELGQVGTKIDQVNSSIIESNLKKLGDIEGAQNFINIVIGLLSGLIFALIFILFRKLL